MTQSGNNVRVRLSGSRHALQVGCVVSSLKGRDLGKSYVVVGIENQTTVRLADGEGRKVEKPKRKNVKHLNVTEVIAGEVFHKAASGKRITNADIRKGLKSLVKNFDEGSFFNKEAGQISNV